MTGFPLRRPAGLPLAIQLIALLVAALIAAQAVTLALTLVFPPEQPRHWDLAQVADALRTGQLAPRQRADLEIQRMSGPPDISGPGWLISPSSAHALAARLHARDKDVMLGFYTQLPVGGVAAPTQDVAMGMGHAGTALFNGDLVDGALGALAPAAAHAEGAPGGAGLPMGGLPGGHFPGGGMPGGHMPGGGMPGGRPVGGLPGGAHAPGSGRLPGNLAHAPLPLQPPPSPDILNAPAADIAHPTAPPTDIAPGLPMAEPVAARPTHFLPAQRAQAFATAQIIAAPSPATKSIIVPTPDVKPQVKPQPIPFRRARTGLMQLTSPPFLEGDFVAAARQNDGAWLAVAPAAEPFPNRWQKQVLAWFLLSLAIISPLAWLFARRIVTPLQGFARAAEALGRDPSTTLLPLTGPAEVGRAAYAFNVMQSRLRAFVDDRTAMVGAISHDLRTPLTRLRFRIEEAPEPLRVGLLKEVTEMEAMIAQVITFIRDASTPGAREMVDFGDLVRASVRDAELVGGHIAIETSAHLPVEVDPVGMRRLLGNLLENAAKYGTHTHVRVTL